jgi:hypothetical protein
MTPKYLLCGRQEAYSCFLSFNLLRAQLQRVLLLLQLLQLLLLLASVSNMQGLAGLGSTEKQCTAWSVQAVS